MLKKKIQTKEKIIKQNLIKDKFSVAEANKRLSSSISKFKVAGRKLYAYEIIDLAIKIIIN